MTLLSVAKIMTDRFFVVFSTTGSHILLISRFMIFFLSRTPVEQLLALTDA